MRKEIKNILITGGSGYIGSSISNELSKYYNIFIIDKSPPPKYIKFNKNILFYKCNILDKQKISKLIDKHPIDAILHFAALTNVSESETQKEKYYLNNIKGSKTIIDLSLKYKIKYFVFASSSAVYGIVNSNKVSEKSKTKPINYYGKTKLITENYIKKKLNNKINFCIFRFFNVSGANIKNNTGIKKNSKQLIKVIAEAIVKKGNLINIYGKNFNTQDGTAIRDYIHIKDLSQVFVSLITKHSHYKNLVINLGNGFGFSVLNIIKIFRKVTKKKIIINFKKKKSGRH